MSVCLSVPETPTTCVHVHVTCVHMCPHMHTHATVARRPPPPCPKPTCAYTCNRRPPLRVRSPHAMQFNQFLEGFCTVCVIPFDLSSRTQSGLTRGDSRLCHARRHACGCCAMHEVLTECLSETAHQLARPRPLHSLTHECLHRRTTMLESMRGCVTDLKWARSRRRSTLLHADDAHDCDTDSEWPEHAVQRRR